MEENRKRAKRLFNFLPAEAMLLMQEVEKFKNIITCERNDKVINHEKGQAWIKITSKFNAKRSNQHARSVEQLMSMYENLMDKTNKCVAEYMEYGEDLHCDPIIEEMMRISPTEQKSCSPRVKIRPVSFILPHKKPFTNYLQNANRHHCINTNILVLEQKNLRKMNEEYDLRKLEKRAEEDRQRKRERDEEDQERHLRRDQEDSQRKQRREKEDWRRKVQRDVEDLQRKCQREEEEHEIKMKILRLELESKQKLLDKN